VLILYKDFIVIFFYIYYIWLQINGCTNTKTRDAESVILSWYFMYFSAVRIISIYSSAAYYNTCISSICNVTGFGFAAVDLCMEMYE
jgi:hypothetical protein